MAGKKVVLSRTGWKKWPEYNCYHNGHHYEIIRYPGEQYYTIFLDGEIIECCDRLKEIRESIAAGDYEK